MIHSSTEKPTDTHKITSWNVEHGGYPNYHSLAKNKKPSLGPIIDTIRAINPDTLVVPDAFGWGNPIVRNSALDQFRNSYFIPLNDSWLKKTEGPHMNSIGIALATNSPHDRPDVIDLGSRSAGQIVLDIGKRGLRICGVYLNHAHESMRADQLRALVAHLERSDSDVPTVIAGDFNAQEVHSVLIGPTEKRRSLVVKIAAQTFSAISHEYGTVLRGLEQRYALEVLRKEGYSNLATNSKPTALFPHAPLFRVDHFYARPGVEAGGYRVEKMRRGASDHRPISIILNNQVL